LKVQLLRNPAAELGCRIQEGESGEIDDPIGHRLISLGIAIEIEQPKPVPVVRAIPDEPAIAEAQAPEIAPVETSVQQVKQDRRKPVVQVPNRKHKES
jgi:hypothetical protein